MQLVWYNKSLVRRVITVTIHYPNGQQPVQHYNTHNELPTPHQSIYAKRGMSLEKHIFGGHQLLITMGCTVDTILTLMLKKHVIKILFH